MRRFGVSNSPLREAFAQLASKASSSCSATAAPRSRPSAAKRSRRPARRRPAPRVRAALGHAPLRAVRRRDAAAHRARLRARLPQRRPDTAYAEADRFGDQLLDRCGSPELAHAFLALLPQLQRLIRLLDPLEYLALQGSLQSAVIASADDRDVESAVAAVGSIWRQIRAFRRRAGAPTSSVAEPA